MRTITKRNRADRRLTLLAFLGTLASLGMGGCELKCEANDGNKVERVIDKIGDKVEDVAEKVKEK